MPTLLNIEELAALRTRLPEWDMLNGKLHRDFHFPSFVHAFAFMTRVALLAEKISHHPEWKNIYNHVSIDLTTHDAGGLSLLDIELAHQINDAYANSGVGEGS